MILGDFLECLDKNTYIMITYYGQQDWAQRKQPWTVIYEGKVAGCFFELDDADYTYKVCKNSIRVNSRNGTLHIGVCG